MTLDSRGREAIATWLTLAAIVVLCLPTLVFSYLPMTDLPQHLAVASILEHHDDARFGFAEHYVVDWWRTPYVLPYALCLAFGKLMPLELAMHVVVFLSVIAYPLAVLALLRVAGKPAWFALLAVPLVYNRAFFWGFINFNLSLGLALAAFALYASAKKSVVRDVVQALLVLAATLCHVYGLALIAALVGAFAVAGGYASLRSRPWSVLPILAGMVLWLVGAREQAGYTPLDPHLDPTFGERLLDFPYSLLGGYQDRSQLGLLVLFVFSFALLAWPSLPTSLARLRALTPLERVAWLAFAGNLLLYFVLPKATETAKFIYFRHAFLACALLPLLASRAATERAAFLVRAVPAITAVVTIASTWVHLALFDREASRFDLIRAAMPEQPRVVALTFEPHGDWMSTAPYMHYAAYIQADKGGMISMTFPAFFWNLPVAMREGTSLPKTAIGLEWAPRLYDEKAFGYYYDYALVRMPGNRKFALSAQFPFELVAASPPWQLYMRRN